MNSAKNIGKNLFHSENSAIVMSAIIGFGLALLFGRASFLNNCIVLKGPNAEELKSVYRIEDNCYKYRRMPINCNN
jgi:hypothetical protein